MPPGENLSKIEQMETKLDQTRPHSALILFRITRTNWVKENASDDAIKHPAQDGAGPFIGLLPLLLLVFLRTLDL